MFKGGETVVKTDNRPKMKIVGICGSPRKTLSRTGHLVKDVLEGAQSHGADIEYVDLAALKIDHCIGCGRCHHLGECVLKDDSNFVLEKIKAADGLVLGSPVYISHVTGLLKNWIDRLGNVIHCQRLLGKYGAVVITTGGSGLKETGDYLEWLIGHTGAQSIGRVVCRLDDGPIPEDAKVLQEARSLGIGLAQNIEKGAEFPEQLKGHGEQRKYFRDVIVKRQEQWDWEYRYWQEKGWL
jgi:multimeric flavodoxin WrbA